MGGIRGSYWHLSQYPSGTSSSSSLGLDWGICQGPQYCPTCHHRKLSGCLALSTGQFLGGVGGGRFAVKDRNRKARLQANGYLLASFFVHLWSERMANRGRFRPRSGRWLSGGVPHSGVRGGPSLAELVALRDAFAPVVGWDLTRYSDQNVTREQFLAAGPVACWPLTSPGRAAPTPHQPSVSRESKCESIGCFFWIAEFPSSVCTGAQLPSDGSCLGELPPLRKLCLF